MSKVDKYVVYNPKQSKPKVFYNTYLEAKKNAQQVSCKEVEKVFVLKVVAEVKTKVEQILVESDDVGDEKTTNLPFNIKKVFYAKDEMHRLSKEELEQINAKGWTDYWLATKLLCEKFGGRMPTMEELGKIASLLYEGNPNVGAKHDVDNLTYNGKTSQFGFPEPSFYVWSGEENGSSYAYGRSFYSTYTLWGYYYRSHSSSLGLCLGD